MEPDIKQCKAEHTLEVFVGKWKPTILFHLFGGGTKRFSELRALMPEITQKMLTSQLRELEEQDVILRVVYPQVPPKVEYSITEHGKSLAPILGLMNEWGNAHLRHMLQKSAESLPS